nr:type II toxin-antitoxin system antitoxin SocA domain-containing protein [Pullulanibacillus pueri]
MVYFLKNSNKDLGRTELMKYLYVFEYYYYQMFGEQFTNLKFERYKFGPNESAVVDATYELQDAGIIHINEYTNYYNSTSYDHRIINEKIETYELDTNAEFVASFVSGILGKENYRGVLEFAYNTPPMKEILHEEKEDGTNHYGRVVDMSKTGPIFKSSNEARLEAIKRLEARKQNKGSDEEYYAHLLERFREFEDTRRRANDVESKL